MTDESFAFWMLLEAAQAGLKAIRSYSGKDISALHQEALEDALETVRSDISKALYILEDIGDNSFHSITFMGDKE